VSSRARPVRLRGFSQRALLSNPSRLPGRPQSGGACSQCYQPNAVARLAGPDQSEASDNSTGYLRVGRCHRWVVVRDGRQLAQPNRSRAAKRHGLAQGVRISPWHGDFQIDLREGCHPLSPACPVEADCKIDHERSACGGMGWITGHSYRSGECWNGVALPPPNSAYR
jgi:hypothetical protein